MNHTAAWGWGLVWMWALAAGVQATSPAKPERVQFLGREYVRLRDWARLNRFEHRWLKPEDTLQLANGSFRLVFTADSRQAQVNGINLWLSYPVAVRGAVAYLSALDLETAIEPVVFPQRSSRKPGVRTVALDPGHGGKETGVRKGPHYEKQYTLLLAQELREQMRKAGLKVVLTRTTDTDLALSARTDFARRRGADVFLSLHFNSAGAARNEAKGVEVFCLTPAGATSTNVRGEGSPARRARGNRHDASNILLAYEMQRALVRTLPAEDRGVRRARFEVLREADMPAVLIEGGFLSHPVEGRKIVDPAYRQQLARAILEGLLAYKRRLER